MAITAFDLLIALGVDSSGVNQGLSSAGKTVSGFASSMSNALSFVGKAGMMALEHGVMAVADGVKSATQSAIALTQQAVSAYGEFEQLAGGTELLFGEASDFVMQKSKQAFKNVQMSQSEYLRQVNGFSTGLKNALGGDALAAAKLADRIVNAEADVVAATGVSAEMVQNAFNGLMRNNYTMLDNLQLGIKPTKEGMEDLIKTVNAWNAENNRATDYQLDNLADLQSAVLDYIEMQGISTYAAKEGSTTIQGSMAALKASWDDIIANLGNEKGGMGGRVINFMETAVATLENNLLPTIERVLNGIGSLIRNLVPRVIREIPALFEEQAPLFIASIGNIIDAVLDVIPSSLDRIGKNLGGMVDSISDSLGKILDNILGSGTGIAESVASLIGKVTDIIVKNLANVPLLIHDLTDSFVEISGTLSGAFLDAIPKIIEALLSIAKDSRTIAAIHTIMRSIANMAKEQVSTVLPLILDIAKVIVEELTGQSGLLSYARYYILPTIKEIIQSIASELPNYVSVFIDLVKNIVGIVVGIVQDNASDFLSIAITIIQALADGAIELLPILLSGAEELLVALAQAVTENLEPFVQMVFTIIEGISGFIFENLPTLIQTMVDVVLMLVEAIDANIDKFAPVAVEMIFTLINGIVSMTPVLFDAILDILYGLQKIMIEHFPMFLQMGIELIGVVIKGLIDGIAVWIGSIVTCVASLATHIIDQFTQIDWMGVGANIITGIIDGFTNSFGKIWGAVTSFKDNFVGTLENVFGIHSPSRIMADKVGRFLALGVGEGFEDNMPDIGGMINTDFNIKGNVNGNGVIQVVSPIYIGDSLLDTYITQANARTNYKSGGR